MDSDEPSQADSAAVPNGIPDLVVIGAGIAGLLTAYHLAESGLRVTVVDRLPEAAAYCSYGNAGIIAIAHAEAWAGPGAIGRMAAGFMGLNPSLTMRSIADPALLRWGIEFLANCGAASFRVNTDRMGRLSTFSRHMLREIEQRHGFQYHQHHEGALYLFSDEKQWRHRRALMGPAEDQALQELTPDGLVELEPSFAGIRDRLVGGFLSRADSSGDCRRFALTMARYLGSLDNVTLRLETEVEGLERRNGRVEAVRTSSGPLACGAVVVAAGAFAPRLLEPFGILLPIYPVKGYSATYPVRDPARVPKRAAIDETAHIGIAPYGTERVRLAGMVEFDRGRTRLSPGRIERLDAYARAALGDTVDIGRAEHWAGSRPITPAGPPFMGRVQGIPNLWINAGHGQLGWTMAAGAGRILAQKITGETPDLSDVSSRADWLDGI